MVLETQLFGLGNKCNCWPKNSAYAPLSKHSPSARKKGTDRSFPVYSLHGKLTAKRRTNTYQNFVQCQSGILLCTDVAARGIDIPDVDWILQYDPPSNPDYFVHRVGRTARAGKEGRSLTFLLPHELDYIDLMRLKHVPLHRRSLKFLSSVTGPPHDDSLSEENEVSYDDGEDTTLRLTWVHSEPWIKKFLKASKNNTVTEGPGAAVRAIVYDDDSIAKTARSHLDHAADACRKAANQMVQDHVQSSRDTLLDACPAVLYCCLKDRDCLERGTRAFISFIRGYREHDCRYIFRLSKLDLNGMAHSFALMSFPHMKDFRGTNIDYPGVGVHVDTSVVPYLDKAREKARQDRVKKDAEESASSLLNNRGKPKPEAKESAEKEPEENGHSKSKPGKRRRGKQTKIFEEWDDLAAEERLAKKRKKGKISQEQYDKAVTGAMNASDVDSDDGSDDSEDEFETSHHLSKDDSTKKKSKDKVDLVRQYTKNMKRREKRGTKSGRRAAVKHGKGVKLTGRKLKMAKKAGKIPKKKT